MESAIRRIKRIFIGVVGSIVLLTGIALMFLPGPAFLVIPLGLGILATEFVWADKLLKKIKNRLHKIKGSSDPHAMAISHDVSGSSLTKVKKRLGF